MHYVTVLMCSLPLVFYLEYEKTYGKAVLGIKCMFHFSLQNLFEIFFILINIRNT
jgi:hypothetical protein